MVRAVFFRDSKMVGLARLDRAQRFNFRIVDDPLRIRKLDLGVLRFCCPLNAEQLKGGNY